MKKLAKNWWIFFWMLPTRVFAANAGAGLEWEAPLERVANSIKGPVGYFISILSIVACGLALAFGGQIGEFVRSIIIVVLVISLIVFAAQLLASIFGIGALI